MTDSFVTQCPHCQTSFRVSHTQLSVARGVVRCGNCLQVFNAAKQLLEQSEASSAVVVSEQPVAPPASSPTPAAPPPAPLVEPPAPEAPPAASQAQWSSTEVDLDQLDLDQELARLEQREIQPSLDFKASPPREDSLSARRDGPDSDDTHFPDSLFSTPADERESPLVEPEVPDEPSPPLIEQPAASEPHQPGERTEPTMSLDLGDLDDEPPVSAPEAHPHHPEHDQAHEPVLEQRLSARDDADIDAVEAPNNRHEPDLGVLPARPRKEALVDLVDDPLQLEWQKPRSNWGRRLLWSLLILLASAALAGQYIAYHFDELARQDQYRPWFQQLCPSLGCKVPSKVDISRIKSSNLVVRSHPDFSGALIVDAIIYNRAPFSQPFPLLELRFADLNGQLIASRRFKPGEYLSGELAGSGEMPSQTPIHIALDILDPGPKAVNYSLSFRSPE
ncbi:DUF3426 domain-containing protein [Pseudomonas fontis]|uniref:Zinc-ribbon domain-containing protein n=1 Tax=Pseudomonas fontis TaxID=2942633 RepID=A0ABT5NZE5_9PSED|nr:DUF3426 domain-containing protein [Pseudomonas fontis]MDD0977402.1 zinc-ribbon domain-containing protein [Pseudomonas fontis]MDD0993571.1 zinc-ribbon domain-containing protein [Pseudomonas fontis]